MTPTLRRKLEALAERREELERLLSDPGVVADNDRFRRYSREFSQLEPLATAMAEEKKARDDLSAAQAMRDDPELAELAEEEVGAARAPVRWISGQAPTSRLTPFRRSEACSRWFRGRTAS